MKDKKFIHALKYINNNLDSVQIIEIATAIGMSVTALKEMFIANTGNSIGRFIKQIKMQRAYKELNSKDEDVLLIALQHGFSDHSAFSRAFREYFGYCPTGAREKINIVNEFDSVILEEPTIALMADIKLAVNTCTGYYWECAPQAWNNLKSNIELVEDDTCLFFGIGHDNPHDKNVAENEVRFSAGVEANHKTSDKLLKFIFSQGYYANFHYTGLIANLGLAYHYIYGKWNNYQIDNNKVSYFTIAEFPDDISKEYQLNICVPVMMSRLSE